MAVFQAPIRFFLGATTPKGFVGYANELYDADEGWQVYLIKSGPGTGKSTLMRRIYEQMNILSVETEILCCSSDPQSLDGVRCPTLKLCILDATAPHVVEPCYWGAVEQIVPLAVCMDETQLHAQTTSVLAATRRNRELHKQCRKYIQAASALLHENRHIGTAALNEHKVHRLAARIAGQEFESTGNVGRQTHRFLSAITPEGPITFYETLQTLCPRIYSVEDSTGAASSMLLSDLAQRAQQAGIDTIVCPCPLAPDDGPEHLLLPTIGVAFTVSNTFHSVDFPVYRRIHATRFMDNEQLHAKRQIQSFNRRAARELLEQAQALAAQAKTVHDEMEQYSIAAMDWEQARRMGDRLVERFVQAAKVDTCK